MVGCRNLGSLGVLGELLRTRVSEEKSQKCEESESR